MGAQILTVLGIALAAAFTAMIVSGSANDMTLATVKHEDMGDHHH
ncbi:MAG: hypothetical protein ACOY46_06280 [Bacillota bacterium]